MVGDKMTSSVKATKQVISKKRNLQFDELLSRQNYLVVQANDLARSFGNLSSFQHKLLDYCFSFVTKDSQPNEEYITSMADILKHFNLVNSGTNYKRIAEAFKALNEKTALYLRVKRPSGEYGLRMTQLFSHIDLWEKGTASFVFSQEAAPYVYNLRTNFYSLRLSELALIKSKYSLVMLKLIEANRMGKQRDIRINGDLSDWQLWFLGKSKDDELWATNRFKRDVLKTAANELAQKLDLIITIVAQKRGRKIVGFEVDVHDNKRVLK